MAMNSQGLFDSAIAHLTESVSLSLENAKAFCLLGDCYEAKKMKEDARKAYEEALKVQPQSSVAKEALNRLDS